MSLYWKWHKDKKSRGKIKGKAGKAIKLSKADTVTSTSVVGSVKRRKHSKEPNRVTGGIKSVPRRVVSLVLVLVTLVSVLIIGVSGVSANSNDRVATYINLAADGEVTDGDTSGMTEDQLRFLGLYLSNFYVPFGTELGTNDDETTNSTKEDMTKSLQQKLAFSEDLSKSLVETIFGYTRSSLKDLSFYTRDQNGYKEIPLVAPNYWNFYRFMIGRGEDVLKFNMDLKGWKDSDSLDTKRGKVANGTYSKSYSDLSDAQKGIVNAYLDIKSGSKVYMGYESGSVMLYRV